MNDSKPRRKLAAILAADVVGFSKMMGENEDRTLENLKACRALTDESIISNHGRIFGSAGDSIIAEFGSPVDAVIAATDFQKNIKLRNSQVDEKDQMLFRVGLNLGDVIMEGENLYGDGVNVAARLEALAEPGGISLSGKFHDEVSRKLEMSFISTGEKEMKNILTPVTTYKIEIPEISDIESSKNFDNLETNSTSHKTQQDEKQIRPPSIAVLPFENMSQDEEQEYFVDGITEDIITNLSLWRTFSVISRNSTFNYKNAPKSIKEISFELDVNYIVLGSVRKGGSKIRISCQLIDAYEDTHIWSDRWDRSLDDIFEVQDEVASKIASFVAPSISGYEQNRLERKRPNKLNAWEEYLRGLKFFNDRVPTDFKDESLQQAKEHLKNAIELDKTFSASYSSLAFCLIHEVVQRIAQDTNEHLDKILDLSQKAEKLDPQNAHAKSCIAYVYQTKGNHKKALENSKKAVEINPNFPLAYQHLGFNQLSLELFADAEISFRERLKLSPFDNDLSWTYAGLALACLGLGNERLNESLEYIDKALEESPNAVVAIGYKAAILGFLESDDAKEVLDQYLKARPNLKTREDYKTLFIPNTNLVEKMIEGLIKAGWEPKN